MKKMKKEKILVVLLVSSLLLSFSACKNKEQETIGGSVISGDSERVEEHEIYNNGGEFVSYKGKTYYREYTNSSIEKVALEGEFDYEKETRTVKYMNEISENGKIRNLFQDSGYGGFYVLDDRFFLAGYMGRLYSVDMNGEDYRDISLGNYVFCDEANHEIYYTNSQNQNILYKINTQNLRITRVSTEELALPIICGEKIYYFESANGEIKILEFNQANKVTNEIATIEDCENLFVVNYYLKGNQLFLSIGHDEEIAGVFEDGKLYRVDLENKTASILDTQTGEKLVAEKNELYYEKYELDGMERIEKKVNLETFKTENVNEKVYLEENSTVELSDGTYVLEGVHPTNQRFLSQEEKATFQQKYATGDGEYLVTVRNVEKVNQKIYFLLELSKHKVEEDIGWRYAFERIASEEYVYDLTTGKKSLIYLYKVTDKNEIASGDADISGENGEQETPLAENEMYLEIKLTDLGLKDTFEVRVEEVGGMIIGKRIEYEGVHSRNEGVLKIKVTKEIGAMLTVYIDGKADTQMLIEE